jgi:NhaA family Na+:H+ antiporter
MPRRLPSKLPQALTRPITLIRSLLATQAGGGYLLMLAAAAAMLVANSTASDRYFNLLHRDIAGMSVLHWVNDGLMALFFLLIGLEIKRELLIGELASWRSRIMPGAAALAGMAAPALVYQAVAGTAMPAARGWAIPSATDIAFALGVLALLGPRVPVSLKLLLTAIAVIDDLGAIVIIAVAYTASLNGMALGVAGVLVLALAALARLGVRWLPAYLAVGAALWAAVHASGIHATLAGVITALAVPARHDEAGHSPLETLEHALSPWVAFAIVPIFGFCNAGVDLRGLGLADALAPVPLGIALGLALGKQLGVFATLMVLVRAKLAPAPRDAGLMQLWGLSLICGIGFTMSLFISALAFGEGSHAAEAAKLGIIAGSLLSALAGYAVLRLAGAGGGR